MTAVDSIARFIEVVVLLIAAIILWPYWLYCDVVKYQREVDDKDGD